MLDIYRKLDDDARRALFAARDKASRVGSRSITPELLLFGVLDGHSVIVRAVLKRCRVDLNRLKWDAETQIQSSDAPSPDDEIGLDDLAANVLRDALAESTELGSDHVGAEHLLLGFLRDPTSPAGGTLVRHGLGCEEARQRVRSLARSREHERGRTATSPAPHGGEPWLERLDDDSRGALFHARYLASRDGCQWIRSEHLLLAILESSRWKDVLERSGAPVAALREEVAAMLVPSTGIDTEIPFDDAVKAALDAAVDEAAQAGAARYHPAHILLGIVRDDDSPTAAALRRHGLDRRRLRELVLATRPPPGVRRHEHRTDPGCSIGNARREPTMGTRHRETLRTPTPSEVSGDVREVR